MSTLCDTLLDRILLWHGTSLENADRISAEGMRPAKKSGQHTHREASWFYHATPDKLEHGACTFIFGVDLTQYVRGREYVHEGDDTIVFNVPLPTEKIAARLAWIIHKKR